MDNLETDTDDDSVTITDTTSDMSDLTNSHYQGVMLLQKLQQLKVWQAAQEELLLEEQRKQINIRMEELDITEKEEEENNTEDEVPQIESGDFESVQSPPAFEDKPVSGGGKTFEQLLEEKLKEENSNDKPTPVTPKPFLRKGSGLARFNINSPETPVNVNKAKRQTDSSSKELATSSNRKLSPRKVTSDLLGSSDKSKTKHVSIKSPPKTLKLNPSVRYNLSDSVENSFCDKLMVQANKQEKDKAELAVFQMLESAANDASFCSNSSKIQSLVSAAILQSPQRQGSSVSPSPMMQNNSKSFVSSTPAPGFAPSPLYKQTDITSSPDVINKGNDVTEDQSLGESIMDDIKKFLAARLAAGDKAVEKEEDDDEWTDESEDETLEENNVDEQSQDVSIGKNWKENIPQMVKPKSSNKENEILTFSPPEKLPPNPPSKLIWDIFGRDNEKKRQELSRKNPVNGKNPPRRKSAPLGVRFDTDNTNKQIKETKKGLDDDQDMSYQSTLLHMRVVELEQEIAAFRQENKKIVSMKKTLQSDKEKLAKELSDFELLKTNERKKIDEEKRRIKRDLNLLEKSKKLQVKCTKCEEIKTDKDKLDKEFKLKETKMVDEISKLKEQLKKVKKENQELQNENQKLKLRRINSKVNIVDDKEPEVVVLSHKNEDIKRSNELKTKSNSVKFEADDESHSRFNNNDGGVKLREKVFDDGHKEVWFDNGNRKEISFDGRHVKTFYYNGDVKESLPDGSEKYLYSQTQTWHTKMVDGTEMLQFSNGQQETRTKDGTTSISFPDGTIKTVSLSGRETIKFPDGTFVTVEVNGDRRLEMTNGQIEEHTGEFKKRIYPDGTVKILHVDGRQETRYANGRIRIRDKDGNLVQDTGDQR